jgi:type I restriction enzyme, R subunit
LWCGYRRYQITALAARPSIETALMEQRHSRSLVQMATAAGKTYTAVTLCYRLLKHAGFRRVLFLVDRNNLGDQTLREFQNYAAPDDGRRFTELYNVAISAGKPACLAQWGGQASGPAVQRVGRTPATP